MVKEREISGVTPEKKREKKDPDFFPLKNGGIHADFIRLQYPQGWNSPRRATGPIVIDNQLMYFHAYDFSEGGNRGPYWAIDAAIPPDNFTTLPLTDPYNEKDRERFRDTFPKAKNLPSNSEGVPKLSRYGGTIVAAIDRAIVLREKRMAEDS